jgi:hypothetical protein
MERLSELQKLMEVEKKAERAEMTGLTARIAEARGSGEGARNLERAGQQENTNTADDGSDFAADPNADNEFTEESVSALRERENNQANRQENTNRALSEAETDDRVMNGGVETNRNARHLAEADADEDIAQIRSKNWPRSVAN